LISTSVYKPSDPLNQFVDTIWFGQSSNLKIESSHYAALFTELIFNYGDAFEVGGQHVEYFNDKYVSQIISGLKTKPFQTRILGTYKCVGLIMKPFCFGLLLDHLGTSTFRQVSEIIYETIINCENPNFKHLEKTLLGVFSKYQLDADLIRFDDFVSETNLGKGLMRDFNLKIAMSQKAFIQKFKRHYLLTPKDYFQLKKINQSIALIENNQSSSLTEIALSTGFYDQSHFIRTFKKFCGYSPKKHLKQAHQVNSVQFYFSKA